VAYILIKKKKLPAVKDIIFSLDLFVKLSFLDIGQFNKIMLMRRGKKTIFKVNPRPSHTVMKQETGVYHHEWRTIDGTHGDYRNEIIKTAGAIRIYGNHIPPAGFRGKRGGRMLF
jgi:hypothetical protein